MARARDDEAGTAIADGQPPFAGRYRPAGLLSVIDGSDAKGTWTLEIHDDSGLDEGTLLGWELVIEQAPKIAPRIASIDPLPPDGGVMSLQNFRLNPKRMIRGAMISAGRNHRDPVAVVRRVMAFEFEMSKSSI